VFFFFWCGGVVGAALVRFHYWCGTSIGMPPEWTQIGMYNPYWDRTVALTTTRPGLLRGFNGQPLHRHVSLANSLFGLSLSQYQPPTLSGFLSTTLGEVWDNTRPMQLIMQGPDKIPPCLLGVERVWSGRCNACIHRAGIARVCLPLHKSLHDCLKGVTIFVLLCCLGQQ